MDFSLQTVFNDKKVVLVSVVILIIGLTLGYLLGVKYPKSLQTLTPAQPAQPTSMYKTNPIFSSQTATINGKVTKIEGDKITVEAEIPDKKDAQISEAKSSEDKVKVETFNLSKYFSVIKATAPGKIASSSAKSSDIQLNKDAIIYLQFMDNAYQVLTIVYSNIPASSPSKKNSVRF